MYQLEIQGCFTLWINSSLPSKDWTNSPYFAESCASSPTIELKLIPRQNSVHAAGKNASTFALMVCSLPGTLKMSHSLPRMNGCPVARI